jgi:nitrogen regulatory protein PII
MNYVISIVNPDALETLTDICTELALPMTIAMRGHGTAVQSMLDLLGIESTEKRIVLTVANEDKTAELIKAQRRYLHLGVPGHGLVVAVPMKSIGGGKAVSYLNGGENNLKYTPEINPDYELIVAIGNEGCTDMIMNAARAAGARGGTVLHGKGTGSKESAKFYNVSIASEKEVILIVAGIEQKAGIMRSILQNAGPDSKAGCIVFSLPTTAIAGFGMLSDNL